jgi:hypothetical protein
VRFYVFLILLISSIFLNGCQEDSKSWQESSPNVMRVLDNTASPVVKSFETYEVVVVGDTNLSEAQSTSQSSKALYGTIDGKSTDALLKLNSNYSSDTQVVVEVYSSCKLVGSSEKIKIGNQSAIDFGNIETK